MSVTVVGDAFIDIIVPIHDVEPGGTYHREILTTCGGTATTAIQVARLGEEASFLGKVGNDTMGQHFKENLKRNQVGDMTVVDADHSTGLCISLVYRNGERSMIAYRGANDYLVEADVENQLDAILKSKIIYLSGYLLASPTNDEAIYTMLKQSREHGCQIWFNPGARNIITKSFRDIIQQFVDVLILNVDEAKYLTGKEKILEMATELERMVNSVVITLREEGCLLYKEGQSIMVGCEALDVAVDTTGAGDAFSAGFIVGRLRQMPDIESAQLAHQAAARFLKEKARLLQ